jgi:AAA+ superfamily predicted ATPase
MDEIQINDLFERRLTFPDSDARQRLARLVGIDQAKDRLAKTLGVLVNPAGPQEWAERHHPGAGLILNYLGRRPPLVILAGDVGTGKTELAETIGDRVARQEKIEVTLFPLSLSTRGSGRQGEMTQLVSSAFDKVHDAARKLHRPHGKAGGGIILLIDEADALAQSREESQMHHEDRAGVNAFIRGVNRLAESKLPAVVILCTNRLTAIDPAVQRRAAEVFTFSRPTAAQRRIVLEAPLKEVGFSTSEIDEMVSRTGAPEAKGLSFTYSDITQRLLPALVLDAYPDQKVRYPRALEILASMRATPCFQDEHSGRAAQ